MIGYQVPDLAMTRHYKEPEITKKAHIQAPEIAKMVDRFFMTCFILIPFGCINIRLKALSDESL